MQTQSTSTWMKRLVSVWCAGRLVTEPFLDGAGVVPTVGEREAAGMAQHGVERVGEGCRHPDDHELLLNPAALIGVRRSVVNR